MARDAALAALLATEDLTTEVAPLSVKAMSQIQNSYAFVLPWSIDDVGGVNEVVKNLIREMGTAGEYDPVLIQSHWPSTWSVVERRPDYTSIRVRLRAPFEGAQLRAPLAFLLSLPVSLWVLARLVSTYRIKAVNIHYPGLDALNWIALRSLRLFPGKVILSFHGSDIRSAHDLRGLPRAAYRYLLRQADVVISCSEGLQGEVLALEPRAKARVIYNGIDERCFGQPRATQTALPAHVQQHKQLIITVGRYEYRKGHDLLLRAFVKVLHKRPSAHLLIVGSSGPELGDTKALVREAGLVPHVTLFKDLPHSDVFGLLRLTQMFVFSSRWIPGKMGEGFPVAILEAALAGIPVLTTRTCGAAELIEDGITGRLVPVDDIDALAAGMCELLENRQLAASMAATLRRKVQTEFTWTRAYHAYMSASFDRFA